MLTATFTMSEKLHTDPRNDTPDPHNNKIEKKNVNVIMINNVIIIWEIKFCKNELRNEEKFSNCTKTRKRKEPAPKIKHTTNAYKRN